MPVTIHIDPTAGLVTYTASGDAEPNEVIEAVDSALHSPDFRPGMKFLWDCRRRTGRALPAQHLRRSVEKIEISIERRGKGRGAFLVSDVERTIGARTFQYEARNLPYEVEVFTKMEDAMGWLNGGEKRAFSQAPSDGASPSNGSEPWAQKPSGAPAPSAGSPMASDS